MVYVQQIEVTKAGSPVNISIHDDHDTLLGDRNWAGTTLLGDRNWAGTTKAVTGTEVLYDKNESDSKSERPFAFLRSEEQTSWQLSVNVCDIPSEFQGQTCLLGISSKDTYAQRYVPSGEFNSSAHKDVSESTAVFDFIFANTTPHGLFGKYNFTLRLANETSDTDRHVDVEQEGLLLECYGLSVSELPAYFEDNPVPLLLLRMFVLPQMYQAGDFTKVETWISLVVNIVFGTQKPFDGRPSDTRNHWLNYDTFHGGAAFSSNYGDKGLNLTAWLDSYRNYQKHQAITKVNCYDQAAITEVALCLGLSHQQIHWEYHQVYGFINKTSLVGWGPCNNPYFQSDTTRAVLSDPKDRTRQPFNNHAYLSWTRNPIPDDVFNKYVKLMKDAKTHDKYTTVSREYEAAHNTPFLMIDSCAGPHVGTESRAAYEDNHVESILSPVDSYSDDVKKDFDANPERWVENHSLGQGVTMWNEWKCPNLLSDSRSTEYNTTVDNIKKMTTRPSNEVRHCIAVDLVKLFAPFKAYVQNLKLDVTHSYQIRPFTTDNGTVVHEWKTNYGKDVDHLTEAVSMRVSVHPSSCDAAQDSLVQHLAFKALSSEQHNITERGSLSGLSPPLSALGTWYVRTFLYNNVGVELVMYETYQLESATHILQQVFNQLREMKPSTSSNDRETG